MSREGMIRGIWGGRKCPRCGAREGAGAKFDTPGPLADMTRCQECQFMWSPGSSPGQGIEWWNDLTGWMRAPAGCMHVVGDVPGDYR